MGIIKEDPLPPAGMETATISPPKETGAATEMGKAG
jgi:hypothetical protein